MLAHKREKTNVLYTANNANISKPNSFFETFFKTGIDPDGLMRVTN